uniref:Uncharacterized protein n=1 Tax=Solanum lycopersicum TaxID=4081 RepID=A0A3Q7IDQ3_SOLLC
MIKKLKDHMNEDYIESATDLIVIKGRPNNRSGEVIFGEVPKVVSLISFGVPIKNENGEKGILIAISLPPLCYEKISRS